MEEDTGVHTVMEEGLKFDYYYGVQSNQFSFYRIPRLLIKDPHFKGLSSDAKLLYGLMLDRMALSMKNNWLDDKNRAYIIYSIDSVMEDLSCSKPTYVKIMKELDMIGLIERRRKGLGKPDIIYVKNFVLKEECEELENEAAEENENETEILEECFEYSEEKLSCQSDDMTATEEENVTAEGKKVELPEVKKFNFCNSKNLTSGSKDFLLPEVKNLAPNYNNNNYNNQSYYSIYPSNLSSQKDEFDGTKEEIDENTTYIEQIKKNLDYEFYMTNDKCNDKALLKELFDLICEVVCVKRKMIKVGGVVYPYEYVRSKFLELTSSHVWYVIDCMKETTTRIVNIKAYLLAALFNAPSTIDYYYQQKVQHDLHSDAVGEL